MTMTLESFLNLIFILVVVVSGCVCGECHFAADVSRDHWLLELETGKNNVARLVNFRYSYAFVSNTDNPRVSLGNYNCIEYDGTGGRHVYLRTDVGQLETLAGTCVQELEVAGIILHKEVAYSQRSGQTEIQICKRLLNNVLLHHVYLPVSTSLQQTVRPWIVKTNTTCPFPQNSYRVTYSVNQTVRDVCSSSNSSVLAVSQQSVNILACDYHLYNKLPLTGQIRCAASLPATSLGEADDSNGDILLLEWTSNTQTEPHYFCARYKQLDSNVMISFDVTSGRRLMCQTGARFDWFGSHDDRDFFLMTLTYDATLGSSPVPNPVTLAPPPATSLRCYIQYSLDVPASVRNPEKETRLLTELEEDLWLLCGITADELNTVDMELGLDNVAVVTFDFNCDTDSAVDVCVDQLRAREQGHNMASIDDGLATKIGDVFYWTSDSLCPNKKCQDTAKCRRSSGHMSCACADGQAQCLPVASVENDQTTTIIASVVAIAVILLVVIVTVVVVMRRRKTSESEEREEVTDYDSVGSMERMQREMYASIGKKPTAYHERQFVSEPQEGTSDYGEKTGVHSYM